MTRLACWVRKNGTRPKRIQGVPAFGTKTREVYDALRRGEKVKNFWGLVKIAGLYNMEIEPEEFERSRRTRGPKASLFYTLKGEWHDHEFYPLERIDEINAASVDFS